MNAFASMLTMLLAAQDVTPAATTSAARTCELTDNACKALLFIEKAAKAPPTQRALYLFTAHRSYVALFAKTGEARHLCAARVNFDRSLAVAGQSEQQRASFEKSRVELEGLEQRHGARCETSRKRSKVASTKVAQAAVPAPLSETAPTPLVDASEVAVLLGAEAESPAPDGLLDVPAARTTQVPARAAAVEAPTIAVPRRTSVPGRPLVIAGGTTLGLGLALAGIAGYAGSRASDASRKAFANYEQNQGMGDVEVLAEQAKLRREFDHWLPVALSTAIAGTTAVIVGAVLVRVGVRKMRQGPSRAALVPVPGGLAIHARF